MYIYHFYQYLQTSYRSSVLLFGVKLSSIKYKPFVTHEDELTFKVFF